ncbi:uncharacterized protein F4807DRAFT_446377 [Annulohypoxylon truncatum]|uniref:uncharacterized protein n=1 Tax=Annulohypoxylon truncatum TaxID=327061 RepID=UPI002007525B|nr:uncharacterized protein F4807DRAFT_446377 [Annulohypoxylon truncatum]KAI1204560.1 hypothetical protein F4807DRAFT_446377 [Annulohypoxylon truncatum]
MYKPAPPRPKQTSIVRGTTGCRTCRARRKKCDEQKPACTACVRLGRRCDGYATKLEFRSVSFPPTESRDHRTQESKSRIPPGYSLKLNRTIKPSKELFYMSIWENQCAPALHPVFHKLTHLQVLSPVIADTMLALAARQLSRSHPQTRELHPLDDLKSPFRPDLDQQCISGEFSSSAMRSVAQWTPSDIYRDSITALVVLTLFCCLESLTSNFQGFYLHSAAVGTLLDIQLGLSSQPSSYEHSIVAAWVQSKMHNWWRRFHFATATFQRDHPPLVTQPTLLRLSAVPDNRVSVLTILCESYRLSAAILMFYCDNALDVDLHGVGIPPNIRQGHSSRSCGFRGRQEEQLNHQRDALSDWYAQLPPSELPTDLFDPVHSSVTWQPAPLQIQPLRFRSHDAAMNFAYYVTARVLQCTEFLDNLESSNGQLEMNDTYNRPEPWIMNLLRIAAGINWDACVRLNSYTIGLSGLLLACILRSNNPALSSWVQDWLSKRFREGCLEEGSFPLFQIIQVLHIINVEKTLDRHVYAVCQAIDDGGGLGKFDSYNSQRIESIVVYGWCMGSNRFYSRHMVLGPMLPR